MNEYSFLVSFPSYAIWSTKDKTPLVHKNGEQKVIPIFTDLDSAMTFVERTDTDCTVAVLPDGDEMKRFLGGFKLTDQVTFDLLDDELRDVLLYSVKQILESINVG